MALLLVGARAITSVDDDTKGVRVINRFYNTIRDQVLGAHAWKFALAQAQLGRCSTDPLFGYACAYHLPADCIRAVGLSQQDLEYRIFGQTLETDYDDSGAKAETLVLEYVKKLTDESLFPALFEKALAYALAAAIARPMVGKNNLALALEQQFRAILNEAQMVDWSQDEEASGIWDATRDSWITARG